MTPPDRERRAREARAEAVRRIDDVGMYRLRDAGVRLATKVAAYEALDAYAEAVRQAVRQAERDRMARVVEGMLSDVPTCCGNCAYDTLFDEQRETFKRVLTALAAPPEQPNG